MKKKITAILLTVSIILSAFVVPAFANTDVSEPAKQKLYSVLDNVVNGLVGGIAAMIKTPNWIKKTDYKTENFYPGYDKADFIDEADNNACWKVGYSNASLLTGKELDGGDYYVGGSLSVTKKLATKQYDDQKVRTVAISDGRGISIFACLDAYGIANTDVRAIRKQFQKYADENQLNITSVNISALHQHSCVDTFGMNGDIVSALFLSSIKTILGMDLPSGQNPDYMKHLYDVTVDSMKNAIEDMTEGTLYFGTVDASKYIYDKRDPYVIEENLNRFRFVPSDEEKAETWIVNAGIHCVGNGAAGTELTGDYPYYMEKYINERCNANLFYIQSAELAITSEYDNIEELAGEHSRYEGLTVFGTELGKLAASIEEETAVDPILNIAFKETWVKIDNNILVLAAKGGLLVNAIAKSGLGKYEIVTEVGYAEIGKDIAIAIIPGELEPAIAFGGADKVKDCWNGETWDYESFQSLAGDKDLLVFGLTNDQIGYMLTNNDWHSFFTENEEIVSCGKDTGATIANTYITLYKEYNK